MQSTRSIHAGRGRAGIDSLVMLAWACLVAATVPASAATSAAARFDYVAVFPAGIDANAIEGWRQAVLGRVHRQACLRDRPCVARMLRTATPAGGEVIAFDLMPQISSDERTALIAAAVLAIPGTALRPDSRPSDLGSGHPQPSP